MSDNDYEALLVFIRAVAALTACYAFGRMIDSLLRSKEGKDETK